jgi:hypothetical protein
VLLDGADVTDVPTDFSTHENGQLEIVFTQHPARFAGTVRDGRGQSVGGAWILVVSADRSLWQSWATTSRAVTAYAEGTFRFASRPGRYLVRALSPTALSEERLTRQQIEELAAGAMPVELGDGELKTMRLTIREP